MLPGPSFEDTQQLNGAIRNHHRTTEQGKVKTHLFKCKFIQKMLFLCILYFRDLFQDPNFEYLIQFYSNLRNSGTN